MADAPRHVNYQIRAWQRSPPPSCSDSAAGESDLPTPGLRSRDSSGSGGGCGSRTPWRASRVLAGCDSDPKPSGSRVRPRNSDAKAGVRVPRPDMKLIGSRTIPTGGGAAHRSLIDPCIRSTHFTPSPENPPQLNRDLPGTDRPKTPRRDAGATGIPIKHSRFQIRTVEVRGRCLVHRLRTPAKCTRCAGPCQRQNPAVGSGPSPPRCWLLFNAFGSHNRDPSCHAE